MVTRESADSKLIEFLVLVAGLLGIVTVVSPSKLTLNGIDLNTVYVTSLIGFMFYSALAYAAILSGKPANKIYTNTSIAYFSGLLAYSLAVNFTHALYQFQAPPTLSESVVFIITYFPIWVFFYWAILWRFR